MEGRTMSDRATPETDALYAQMLAENPGNFIHLEEFLELACRLERERDEARELLRILAGLVAYGIGQSGEEWSLEAMRQATTAIKNAKFLEETK
jgi:hypothetical protein